MLMMMTRGLSRGSGMSGIEGWSVELEGGFGGKLGSYSVWKFNRASGLRISASI